MNYDSVVTVTGAAGFVGSALVKEFLNDNTRTVKVFGTDLEWSSRLDSVRNHENFFFEEYDAMQPIHSDMLAVDTLYHFAGIANPQVYLERPIEVMDLNLMGLRNILDRITRWRMHRPRIVYSSTSEVYGKSPDVPFDEEGDLVYGGTQNRRWCYAMTKAVSEHYLQAFGERDDVRYTIFRFFNFVGRDIDAPGAGRVITRMVGDALDTGVISVTEPGTQTRCFTFEEDFVKALVLADRKKKNTPGFRTRNHILNLGSDEEISMRDLAEKIALILTDKEEIRIETVSTDRMYGAGYEDVKRRVPNVKRASEELGWKAYCRLDDFLPIIVEAAAARHLQR